MTTTTTTRPRYLQSKYAGTCEKCSQPFAIGDWVAKQPGERSVHQLCPLRTTRSGICRCGGSLSPTGRCDSVTLFGEHQDGSL